MQGRLIIVILTNVGLDQIVEGGRTGPIGAEGGVSDVIQDLLLLRGT